MRGQREDQQSGENTRKENEGWGNQGKGEEKTSAHEECHD